MTPWTHTLPDVIVDAPLLVDAMGPMPSPVTFTEYCRRGFHSRCGFYIYPDFRCGCTCHQPREVPA